MMPHKLNERLSPKRFNWTQLARDYRQIDSVRFGTNPSVTCKRFENVKAVMLLRIYLIKHAMLNSS